MPGIARLETGKLVRCRFHTIYYYQRIDFPGTKGGDSSDKGPGVIIAPLTAKLVRY